MKSLHTSKFTPALCAVLWVAFLTQCSSGQDEGKQAKISLHDSDMPKIAKTISDLWYGESVPDLVEPEQLMQESRGVYFSLRRDGYRVYHTWGRGDTIAESIHNGISNARKDLDVDSLNNVTHVEISIAHSFQPIISGEVTQTLGLNIYRGLYGLEVSLGRKVMRYTPNWFIENNRRMSTQVKLLAEEWGLVEEDIPSLNVRIFETESLLISLENPIHANLMYRGNRVVELSDVTQANVERLMGLMSEWLIQNVHENGRITYKYYPSRREESNSTSLIRQWMATIALEKTAILTERQAIWDLVERNIDYNLGSYYRQEGDNGFVAYRDTVKLGALALAALAIVQHPKRKKWGKEEKGLLYTVEALWNESGKFVSFYSNPNKVPEQQNFYPGEALNLWALLIRNKEQPGLENKFMKSFDYYRVWHLDPQNRNPAFVPWHTQAYYEIWEETKNEELQEFIFEMNDWLLGMQQWDSARYPDIKGRFYDPNRPHYGPPHASSTGVYLEGLVDAYRLAQAVGDTLRIDAYRKAIVRGIRSLMQLQFQDDIDMFYTPDRKYVKGGLRTTVYNNIIRCDNVQHGLMALQNIYQTFAESDYQVGVQER